MKRITTLFSIAILFLSISQSVSAQQLRGIRVESNAPIEVFIDGEKACNPVYSCLIANLRRGQYLIEVFSASPYSRDIAPELLFSERVFYSGRELKDIFVSSGEHVDEDFVEDFDPHFRPPMNEASFNEFFGKVKNCAFDSDRKAIIEMAVPHATFYTAQVERLAKLYSFDSERLWLLKKIYPSVIDKERTFVLLDLLTFSSSKDELKRFIQSVE